MWMQRLWNELHLSEQTSGKARRMLLRSRVHVWPELRLPGFVRLRSPGEVTRPAVPELRDLSK
jgi:hypothetical protein